MTKRLKNCGKKGRMLRYRKEQQFYTVLLCIDGTGIAWRTWKRAGDVGESVNSGFTQKCWGVDGNHYYSTKMSITESSEWVCADGWSPK
jgi:hypothetical protein